MRGIKTISVIAAVVVLSPFQTMADSLQESISAFDAIDCKPVIENELDVKNIDRSKIQKIDYYDRSPDAGETGAGNRSYHASVTFSSCTGSLEFALDGACFIERTFATGQCKQEGYPTK